MRYALIEYGVVVNLICLHTMNESDFPNAIPTGDHPVEIGDTYEDDFFYRNGELLKSNAEIRQEEIDDMQAALAELGVTVNE